jgi:4-amino-4-deoxy-L-arabinose transferase-like glycosyltransferase
LRRLSDVIPPPSRMSSPSTIARRSSASSRFSDSTTKPFVRRIVERHSLAAVLAIAIAMCFAGTFQHGLWTPDEPREAEIGREMMLSGLSPMPMLDGEPFLEKPPLFPWSMSLAYRAFGVSPGVARLPSALFSIGAILVAYALGRRAGGRSAGVASAIVLATTVKFAEISHCAINDTALTFFVAAGHLGFLAARDRERCGEKSIGLMAAGACAGFAFLTKSIIGPVLVAGPPLVAAAVLREWRFLRFAIPRAALWCTLFVGALGVPWVLALANTGGWSAVRVCLIDNTLGRSLQAAPEFGHANGPLYYLGVFPLEALLWMIVLPAMIASGALARSWRAGRANHLAWLVAAGLVILSLPSTKRGLYALPLYPAAAAAAGAWLSRAGSSRGGRFDRITLTVVLASIGIVLLAVAGSTAWIAWGGSVPARLESSVRFLREHYGIAEASAGASFVAFTVIVTSVAGAAGLSVLWIAARSRTRSVPWLARASAIAALAAFSIWLCAVQPFIDPLKDMSRGARESMADVPASEPLLGLALDETSRAVIPYYTGRLIRNVSTPEEAIEALKRGPSKHLVVMDNGDQNVSPELRADLRAVSKRRLDAARALNVYRYEPKP